MITCPFLVKQQQKSMSGHSLRSLENKCYKHMTSDLLPTMLFHNITITMKDLVFILMMCLKLQLAIYSEAQKWGVSLVILQSVQDQQMSSDPNIIKNLPNFHTKVCLRQSYLTPKLFLIQPKTTLALHRLSPWKGNKPWHRSTSSHSSGTATVKLF